MWAGTPLLEERVTGTLLPYWTAGSSVVDPVFSDSDPTFQLVSDTAPDTDPISIIHDINFTFVFQPQLRGIFFYKKEFIFFN